MILGIPIIEVANAVFDPDEETITGNILWSNKTYSSDKSHISLHMVFGNRDYTLVDTNVVDLGDVALYYENFTTEGHVGNSGSVTFRIYNDVGLQQEVTVPIIIYESTIPDNPQSAILNSSIYGLDVSWNHPLSSPVNVLCYELKLVGIDQSQRYLMLIRPQNNSIFIPSSLINYYIPGGLGYVELYSISMYGVPSFYPSKVIISTLSLFIPQIPQIKFAAPQEIHIVNIADPRDGTAETCEVVKFLNTAATGAIDIVTWTGDYTGTGTNCDGVSSSVVDEMKKLVASKFPSGIYYTRGNHESASTFTGWFSVSPSQYYANIKGYQLVTVDMVALGGNYSAYNYANDLNKIVSTSPVIVLAHPPIIETCTTCHIGTTGTPCSTNPAPCPTTCTKGDHREGLNGTSSLRSKVLGISNIKLVFHGHTHDYGIDTSNNRLIVVDGSLHASSYASCPASHHISFTKITADGTIYYKKLMYPTDIVGKTWVTPTSGWTTIVPPSGGCAALGVTMNIS